MCQFEVPVPLIADHNNDTPIDEELGIQITEGFVFSSFAILENIKVAMSDKTEGVSLAMDGTYKLLFNGWVLIVLSTHTVNYTTSQTTKKHTETHSAIPMLFCLVRTEAQPAFDAVLSTLKLVRTLFL